MENETPPRMHFCVRSGVSFFCGRLFRPAAKKRKSPFIRPALSAGQSLSLVLGENAVTYDLVVPNSAIREDNNGKFVLILDSRSTPFGNRYIARRADVTVVASDDANSAITGNIDPYSYVITTSTAPISSGDQVRLQDTNS